MDRDSVPCVYICDDYKIVIDNGECTVDSYCKCGANGKAVPSDTQGFRVVERLDDTHIRIIL